MSELKRTGFYQAHLSAGAKMVPFAGFEMPVQYQGGIIQEHEAVRTKAGLFDVSHMGEFYVSGQDAESFLNKISVNDVSKLVEGKAQYTAMCNPEGGIIDDMIIYKLPDQYMVVVNASNRQKDLDWMQGHQFGDVVINDRSDSVSLLAVQGPQAEPLLSRLTDAALEQIPYYGFLQAKLAGYDMIISRTGYTGEPGFELYFDNSYSMEVWTELMSAGGPFGLEPVGLGCRDTLRTEMGYALYGNDIDETRNTIEAGLGWITKLSKPDFIGKGALEMAKANGTQQLLTGIVVEGRQVPRHGFDVLDQDEKIIGVVTSGTFSPSLQKGIAMAYVNREFATENQEVGIRIRQNFVPGTVSKFPFYKPSK